jgi:hypothetical protein
MDAGADLRQPQADTQPETRAVMAWTLSRPWAASANMHEGAIVSFSSPWCCCEA